MVQVNSNTKTETEQKILETALSYGVTEYIETEKQLQTISNYQHDTIITLSSKSTNYSLQLLRFWRDATPFQN